VLAIGSELLDGRTLERNSNYLCTELHARGIAVAYSIQCGDALGDILASLDFFSAQNISIVLITGGLGPTVDDRTREAVARFLDVPLERDPAVVATLEAWFAARGRPLSESNLLQADKPVGSAWIKNDFGTAPGFLATRRDGESALTLLTFPGIPRELKGMFQDIALPLLADRLPFRAPSERVMRLFGLPESGVNDRIKHIQMPDSVEVIFNVDFPVISVILRSDTLSASALDALAAETEAAIEDRYIFSRIRDESHASVVVQGLATARKTIAVAESCTGGVVGSLLTDVPGASAVFRGGIISYSNDVKRTLLGVSAESLEAYGAVSEQVAIEMAAGAKRELQSDFAISITGIAGPTGGTAEKPVGTVCIGFASETGVSAKTYAMPFDRERFRRLAAFTALEQVRRTLQGIARE
jgi:nicotinamide-nucleotide amidase